MFEHTIERKIREAELMGEFENLPGMGEPLNLDDDSDVPPESRMAYRILKNAGVIPEEIQLRKELIDLKALIEYVPEDQAARRKKLMAKLDETQARYFAALERRNQRR